ncbi:MAG: glutathione S-transferase family protein [Pseudomonadota bacterium]
MLKLLGRKTSGNVQKIIFLLEEAGIEYEREDYGRQFENTQTPEYLVLNPTAKVPTLKDGDVTIWESHSILRYLAETKAPLLTGIDAAERSEVERWMDFLLATINSGYVTAFKGAKLDPAERPAGFDAEVAGLHAGMAIISNHLDGKDTVALGKLTIADIALAPIMGRCLNFPLERPAMPGLEAWFAKIAERPAFKAATT